jgi:hypothetical protein
MSQQINLLLPELKPRVDWLALPVVAAFALVGLLLLVGLATVTAMRAESLRAKEAAIKMQLLALQQQVQTLGQSLGARQGDSLLDTQIAAARLGVAQRQEVLASNIANADTPNYKARDIDFSSALQGALAKGSQSGGTLAPAPTPDQYRHTHLDLPSPVHSSRRMDLLG